jgi:hypothetical protein
LQEPRGYGYLLTTLTKPTQRTSLPVHIFESTRVRSKSAYPLFNHPILPIWTSI